MSSQLYQLYYNILTGANKGKSGTMGFTPASFKECWTLRTKCSKYPHRSLEIRKAAGPAYVKRLLTQAEAACIPKDAEEQPYAILSSTGRDKVANWVLRNAKHCDHNISEWRDHAVRTVEAMHQYAYIEMRKSLTKSGHTETLDILPDDVEWYVCCWSESPIK